MLCYEIPIKKKQKKYQILHLDLLLVFIPSSPQCHTLSEYKTHVNHSVTVAEVHFLTCGHRGHAGLTTVVLE